MICTSCAAPEGGDHSTFFVEECQLCPAPSRRGVKPRQNGPNRLVTVNLLLDLPIKDTAQERLAGHKIVAQLHQDPRNPQQHSMAHSRATPREKK